MAKIPTQQFGTRLSSDVRAKPTQSIQAAGIVGVAQSKALQSAVGFAGDIAARREKADAEAYVNSQNTEYAKDAQNHLADVSTEFSGAKTKGRTDELQKRLTKSLNQRLKAAPSTAAHNALVDNANQFNSRIVAQQQSKENIEIRKYNRSLYSKGTSTIAMMALQSPDPLGTESLVNSHIESIRKATGVEFNADEGALLEAETRVKAATGTIAGMMRLGQYDKAKNVVDQNYLQAFNAESKQKMLDKIAGKKQAFLNDKERKEHKEQKLLKEKKAEEENATVMDLLSRHKDGEDVDELVEEAISKGVITTKANVNFLNANVLDESGQEQDDLYAMGFDQRLAAGEDPKKLMKLVQKDAIEGRLSSKRAVQLSKIARSKAARLTLSPSERREASASKVLLDSIYPSKNRFRQLPENAIMKMELTSKINELTDNFNIPIGLATRAVVKETTPVPEPIEGLEADQTDPVKNHRAIMQEIKAMKKEADGNKEEISRLNNLGRQQNRRKSLWIFQGVKSVRELKAEYGGEK